MAPAGPLDARLPLRPGSIGQRVDRPASLADRRPVLRVAAPAHGHPDCAPAGGGRRHRARTLRSRLAPKNLSTVLTWIHYRGLLIGALLAAGNVFCGACPMILVRDLGRRLHRPTPALAAVARTQVGGARRLFVGGALRLRAVRPVVAAGGDGVARDRLLRRRRCVVDMTLHRRGLLQARLPGRPVQLSSRLDAVAAGGRRRASLPVCRSCTTVDCIKGRRDESCRQR